VGADVNITYKILYNDAVAMTGGQPVDGPLTVPMITRQVLAEGVKQVRVVTDEPEKYKGVDLPAEVTVHHRDDLDAVQRELREIPGATVLVYDQTCAAEKRRRRKRGTFPDPQKRVVINELVCEGCGDCSVKSNCLSVVPVETEFGRKRAIDQSSCNKDYSCLKGFCPSFVTVEGGQLRKRKPAVREVLSALPRPALPPLDRPYGIMVTGIGGTGVVTIGAILGMAAHIEGKGAAVLDMAGLAQKGGEVAAHLRIAADAAGLTSPRLDALDADALIAGDLVMAASARMLEKIRPGATRLVVNDFEIPTGEFTRDADLKFPKSALKLRLETVAGAGQCDFVDAVSLAKTFLGDAIATNIVLLGFAFQKGLLPLTSEALEQAIAANGTAVEMNRAAFRLGRLAAHKPEALAPQCLPAQRAAENTLEDFAALLEQYQDARWAARYRSFVAEVARLERERCGSRGAITETVERNLARLMTYKDEYEVGRLFCSPEFAAELERNFGAGAALTYHLAPPMLGFLKDPSGRPRKFAFGAWMKGPFALLSRLRFLRGTAFDPFGYSAERRRERAAIDVYEERVMAVMARATAANRGVAADVLDYAERIRGYGFIKDESFARAEAAFAERMAALEGVPLSNPAHVAEVNAA
jgi:indolepyruvate ferredoxin oxidoreductase